VERDTVEPLDEVQADAGRATMRPEGAWAVDC
jgi:hypothetical protein